MENFTDEQFSDGAIDVLQKAGIRMCVDAPHSKMFKIDRCFPEPWMAMLTVQILVDLKKGSGMAELTQDQVERAHMALNGGAGDIDLIHKSLHAAAPFLQLPWDEPTPEEMAAIDRDWIGFAEFVREFVRRRNAALLPEPVDPRIAIVKHQLTDAAMSHGIDVVAGKILLALDRSASQSDDHVG